MEKKIWAKPVAIVEEFQPNEYVAACWGVACAYEDANAIERELNGFWGSLGVYHRESECGNFEQQAIITDEKNNAIQMVEIKGDTTLTCTIYTDATYTDLRDISEVKHGDIIYWTTEYRGTIYHHTGKVELVDGQRVNHS